MFEQFMQLLNGLEDGEQKSNLVTAFDKISAIHKDTIESRDSSKSKLNELNSVIDGIKLATGLEDLSVDSLKNVIKNGKDTSKELELANARVNELQAKYQDLEVTHKGFVENADKKAFELAVQQSDIFADVVSDPFLRQATIDKVLPNLTRGEDGKLYAKNQDGSILTDLVTNKPVTGQELFKQMVDNGAISKAVLNSTVKQGAGEKGGASGKFAFDISKMTPDQLMNAGRQ